MATINNVEFLTLPQQVSKNKRDIQVNTQDIGSLTQTVDNIQAGISNIPMLNDIIINAVGVPQALSGTNKAILLDNLKNQALIKGEDKTISWALHIQVMGSLVGDSAFPNILVDYDINLSNITYAGSDNNRFYRIRGFSRDFTFVVECNIDTTNEGWMFTVDPTIMMATIVQPSTYYTEAINIVGGVVLLSNLSPSGAWIKAGDLVISGNAIYIIQSITGNQATLTAQTGFVAPTGALTFTSFSGTSATYSEAIKARLNKALGVKIFDNDVIAGTSLEEQIVALGLTLKVGWYLTYDYIGTVEAPTYQSHVKGLLAIGISNTSGSSITTTGIANLGSAVDNYKSQIAMVNTINDQSASSFPTAISWTSPISRQINLSNYFIYSINNITIANDKQLVIHFSW